MFLAFGFKLVCSWHQLGTMHCQPHQLGYGLAENS
ncbi:hypothetical protein J2Z31_003890 [Sinorhizobium kostiense]|uniref:Uncharacterized protein n=1 Tax=Sinorhizobium kostiense TaxID=76747 RepID=A0ABS4R3A0_9HYPH|nr:hypothetical protein [Sinorhizobium kostiense]